MIHYTGCAPVTTNSNHAVQIRMAPLGGAPGEGEDLVLSEMAHFFMDNSATPCVNLEAP